jgi:hypothetical protein
MNKGTAVNCTIPPNSSVAFPIGTQILIYQNGAGTVTLVAGAGVTLVKKSNLVFSARYGVATIIKILADGWVCYGDLT